MKNDLMDENEFWSIIEKTNNSDDGPDVLREEVSKLSSRNIIMFDCHIDIFSSRAHRLGLARALNIINGYSNDNFLFLRIGLIARGKEIYKKAIENPDSLADIDNKVKPNYEIGYLPGVMPKGFNDEERTEGILRSVLDELSAEQYEDLQPQLYSPSSIELAFSDEINMKLLPKLMEKYGNRKRLSVSQHEMMLNSMIYFPTSS